MINPAPEKLKLNLFGKILVVLVIIGVGVGIWLTARWLVKNNQVQRVQVVIAQDPVAVVNNIRKLIILPTNENPTTVQIQNADDLKREQPFYQDAKNGDWVVVYLQAKKAVIYDAINNILVNVGPIYLDNALATSTVAVTSTTTATSTASAVSKLTVEIRNGSGVKGWAAAAADKLKGNDIFEVTQVGNAVGNNYQGNILVNLAGESKSSTITELQKLLQATIVTSTPTGELTSTADALIIVGK